jgi:predicted membrane protein
MDTSTRPVGSEQSMSGSVSRERSTRSKLFLAVFLIVAGLLLFLANVGILPVRNPWDYWPVLLIAAGIAKWIGGGSAGEHAWAASMIVFGALFLSASLGLFHVRARDGSWPLAILFIALGIGALAKAVDTRSGSRPLKRPAIVSDALTEDTVVFGAAKRRIDSANFQGGDVHCTFGSVEIDLRRAQIAATPGSATLDVTAIFSSVKLRIPEHWRVRIAGAAIMGAYEDKTIPQAIADPVSPVLVITGTNVGSAVEIEN